ncbi:hypothetical protein GGX14DRAFT_383784 [Mycena pura]|uniref:Uncharacterized protein n=1 Tax=Mycena pura TaxID=153505 RepID=A0AAD6YUY9_9AGAR|nr:hypothetical protein GGX14DRAFT_383784 [Mycena pura]
MGGVTGTAAHVLPERLGDRDRGGNGGETDGEMVTIAIHNRAENYGSYRAWSYCSCRYLSSLARTAGNQELPRSDSGQPGAIISYQTTGISYPVSWDPKRWQTCCSQVDIREIYPWSQLHCSPGDQLARG